MGRRGGRARKRVGRGRGTTSPVDDVVKVASEYMRGHGEGLVAFVDKGEVDADLEAALPRLVAEFGDGAREFVEAVEFESSRMAFDRGPTGRPTMATLFVLPLRGDPSNIRDVARDPGAPGEGDAPGRPAAMRALARAMVDCGLANPGSRIAFSAVPFTVDAVASLTCDGIRRILVPFADAVSRASAGMMPDMRRAEVAIENECCGESHAGYDPSADAMHGLFGLSLVPMEDPATEREDFFKTMMGFEGRTVDGAIVEDYAALDAAMRGLAPANMDSEAERTEERRRLGHVEDAIERWLKEACAILAPHGVVSSLPCDPKGSTSLMAAGVMRGRLARVCDVLPGLSGLVFAVEGDGVDCHVRLRRGKGGPVVGEARVPCAWLDSRGPALVLDQVRRFLDEAMADAGGWSRKWKVLGR